MKEDKEFIRNEALIKFFEQALEDAKRGNIILCFLYYLRIKESDKELYNSSLPFQAQIPYEKFGCEIFDRLPLREVINQVKFVKNHLQESIIASLPKYLEKDRMDEIVKIIKSI